jgi:HSP20 family molecular chaperone IbpA
MAIAENKTQNLSETREDEVRYRITPRYGVWTEKDHLLIQVALPGVKKEDIEMKALKDYFTLRAKRGEIMYALDLDFGIDVEPNETEAKYEEGLLKVKFKRYNPLEHAYEVKIE